MLPVRLHRPEGMIGTYFDGEINMLKEFEKQNPDIDLVYYDITGGNEAYHPIDELLNSGDAPDLLISSYVLKDTSKLEDLTDYEGVSNFDMGTLMQNTTDGHAVSPARRAHKYAAGIQVRCRFRHRLR